MKTNKKALQMVMVAKLMTFSDVLIKLNKHNVSFASTLCHDGHMIFFVGSCPIEFMMEAACLRAPVFHGAPGKPDVATPDRPC